MRRETAEKYSTEPSGDQKEEEEEDLLCKTYLLRVMISPVIIDGYICEKSLHCN
jgi:hypothetical protein